MNKRPKSPIFFWVRWHTVKKIAMLITCLFFMICAVSVQFPYLQTSSYWSMPLSGKVIAIDAGHGGPDGGAVNKQGLIEKHLNLCISLYIRDYLQQAGAIVIMTREKDIDLALPDVKGYANRKREDLKERVRKIEQKRADMFISVHMNSVPSHRWSGAQVFYTSNHEHNANFATLVQQEIRCNLENTSRQPQTINTVYILKALKTPSILVEVGFLSHPEESKLLAEGQYQRKVARAIYQGILRYSSGEVVIKK